MEEKNNAVLGWAIAALVVLCTVIFNIRCTSTVSGGSTETTNGKAVAVVYNSDGSRAVHAKVSFVSVGYNPQTGLGKASAVDSTVTDDTGGYSAHGVAAGVYNILAAGTGNGELSYKDSVTIGSDSSLPNDTLKAPGSIRGVVRLQPGDDARTVFILFMGTYTFRTPQDSIGNFTAGNLADGSYHVKILTTTPNYAVLDTNLSVKAGKDSLLPDTIRLKYTGIPTPTGLKISYDTLKQIVTLTWNRPTTGSAIAGYNIYRERSDSTSFVSIKNGLTDTVYRDSTGAQDQTYAYRVAAVDTNGSEGVKSAEVTVSFASAFKLLDSLYLGYSSGNSSIVYNGDSLLVDRTNDMITIIDTSLAVSATFSLPASFGNGMGLGVDWASRIWASNYSTGRVNICSKNGMLVDSIVDPLIRYPTVLRLSPDGRMFINSVVSPIGSPVVEQIRTYNDSARAVSFFPDDSAPISWNQVSDMLFDVQGNLEVLDATDSTISVYSMLGSLLRKQKLPSYTVEFLQLRNGFYIIKQDGGAGIIQMLNANFSIVSIFGTGLVLDYRYFGNFALDSFNRLVVRRGNSVLLYGISSLSK